MDIELKYDGQEFVRRIERLWNAKEKETLVYSKLAEKMSIAESQISRWKSAKEFPKIDTLYKLSICLDCSIETLLGLDEKPREKMSLEDFFKIFFAMYVSNDFYSDYFIDIDGDVTDVAFGNAFNGHITFSSYMHTVDGEILPPYDFCTLFDKCKKIVSVLNGFPVEQKLELIDTILKRELKHRDKKERLGFFE